MVSKEIKDAIKTAIAESMGDIVTATATATKRALADDLEKAVEKRAKLEEKPTFRRKFNEDQFKHSKEMERIMDKISGHLENNDKDKAKEVVEEGKTLICKRQKLIRIADREEDGWEVIKCYQSDALASDSDDENRLNKSRRQAKLNKKEHKEKRLGLKKRYERFENRKSPTRDYISFSSRYQGRDQKVCYSCGREGHMQYSCPTKKGTIQKGVCREYEFDSNCKTKVSVVGRLKKNTQFWKNISACHILSVGSSKTHLQSLALKIFKYCLSHNIQLQPNWVPRDENQIADYYSKYNDTDDWSIDEISFYDISERFGPFTIDRFADNLNTQTRRFNSKFYCPQTEDVNCFTKNWKGENNFYALHFTYRINNKTLKNL